MSKNADTAADNPLIRVAMKAHHETAMHMNRSAFACLQAAPDSVCGRIPTGTAHPVASSERDAVIEKQRFAACRNEQLATQVELRREILMLREALTESDDLIALHKIYRESAEKRAAAERESTRAMRVQLSKMDVLNRALQAEASAMERVLNNPSSYLSGRKAHPLAALQGKRVLYVGGRPGSLSAIQWLVEASGGTMACGSDTVDCTGLLAAALPDVDMLMFPADCIDDDTVKMFEWICERNRIACYQLRTASLASFVELIDRLSAFAKTGAAVRSARFCQRHG
ncbi:hypothetical protein QF000_000139 [Paraburkholderia atlantica]|uniref:DUF2325 domain-containing protein n=2 Tax=Paraburkholderia TaxID=1822464 RepID=A0A7W8LE97_9BURK|nr:MULTISPECIES: DUF2325 domain-containing protein [Paraburkholderia]MBB5405372.1 hypothetical protein [Paraburkholderia youngii]MBB5421114.1 hypothetical protein [Paraburkholderia atlantica]MBB5429166.1 hypothetical protein [Paraburkholderia atlantica]MPW11104.1 DUF2325 domain-containing protein [Paraburkholderia atlantica]NUY35614.1 DUF2325 domain-containing protein [Paraburkholderia atlantica]